MKLLAFAGLRPLEAGPAIPFELVCTCGQALRGERQMRYQLVRCSACGAERFVLPRSRLPAVLTTADTLAPASRSRWLFWTWPLTAAGAALMLAALAIFFLIRHTGPDRAASSTKEPSDEERLQTHLTAGRSALAEGAFHRASTELAEALALGDRMTGRWKTAERRQVAQQQRQAALLTDLLSDSLADIVRQSIGMPADEWQEAFRLRYANRSVLLDTTIHRELGGQIQSSHRIRVGDLDVKLDLRRLKLLEQLFEVVPSPQPQRILLGMRLSGLRHDNSGWLIVPEANSGVLITDRDVIAGLSLPNASEYEEVLRRQQGWLDLLP